METIGMQVFLFKKTVSRSSQVKSIDDDINMVSEFSCILLMGMSTIPSGPTNRYPTGHQKWKWRSFCSLYPIATKLGQSLDIKITQ